MKTRFALALTLTALLVADAARAGGELAPIPDGVPTSPAPVEAHSWSHWIFGQELCRPGCCEQPNWPGLLEIFVRTGPLFILDNGPLQQRLETGIGVEGGARTFCYSQEGSAAWTGELAVGHSYHNSNDPSPLPVGSQSFALRVFQLTSVRFGGGREWYWQPGGEDSARWFTGVSGGGRLGSANARFRDGPQITDFAKGIYLGLDAGVLIPWQCRQIVIGGRAEWERDWFEIDSYDVNLDRFNLLFTAGIRY
ncbi:MAG: hypothetical protein AB7K24_06780 [Gemmataceae bacterium]